MAAFVEGRLGPDTGDVLAVISQHFDDFLVGMRFDAEVVAGEGAVLHRIHDPVNTEAELMQHFADKGRDFGGIDAVGAEQGATSAFGALVGVVEEFLDDAVVQLPGADGFAEELAQHGVIAAVEGAEKLDPEHGHVLRIVGAEEELALIGAGAAAHTDVHEHLEGAVLLQAIVESITEDFFPAFRQVPVFGRGIPAMGMRHVQLLHGFHFGRIAEAAGGKFRLVIKPALGGECRPAGNKFLWGW